MALYLHYTETDLESGFAAVSGNKYLGSTYFHVLTNEDSLGITIAPRKAAIDLRTMKVLALDLPLVRGYTMEEMVKVCEGVK